MTESGRSNRSIRLQGAKEVQARVRMYKGHLVLGPLASSAGSDMLLRADYHFETPVRRPELAYEVDEGQGYFIAEQNEVPTIGVFPKQSGDLWNRWQLHIAPQVPLDLEVVFGEGAAELDLGALSLEKLRLTLGRGRAEVDLSRLRKPATVSIHAGEGALSLRLSKNLATVVSVKKAEALSVKGFRKEGDLYYNASYKEGSAYLYVNLTPGKGQIQISQD